MVSASARAEMAVLGALLIDPEAIGTVSALVRPTDFEGPRLRLVYEAALALHARGIPTDYVAVCCEMERRGTLPHLGGDWALTALINECPCSLHAPAYARLVADAARRRRPVPADAPDRYGIAL